MVSLGRRVYSTFKITKIRPISFIIKIFIVSLSVIQYGSAAKLIKFNEKQQKLNFQAIKLIKVPANKLK